MDLSELDAGQRAAVTAPDGPHLVIAGAGTGKTRTLVHRVAWLIDRGEAPEGIVLLTFTRRAAGEMLDRVARIVGPRAHGVRGGTFHGFAATALRRHAELVGFPPGFTILDRGDAEGLVGMVRTELELGGKERRFAQKGTILSVLSRAVNTGASLADVLADQFPQYADDLADFERIGARYAERKRQQGVVDFDDLLVLLDRLLTEHPEARRRLSSAARHVLVDEYQDTNRLQARIAALLASVHGNLMVVGDEAQAIYGFRGAAVENILEFPQLFPGCGVSRLETSYRSSQPVLDLANGVLASATRGFDKHLVAAREGGELPVLLEVADEHGQADEVVRRVLAWREDGIELRRQAVLFRSSHHANLLELALSEANVPYRKYGGLKFTEAAHVKDVFALLRLVANPRDALAWVRVLGWFEGVGARTAQQVADAVSAAPQPRLDPERFRGRRWHADAVSLATLLHEAGDLVVDLGATVDKVVGWYRERLPGLYDDGKRRERDLESLALLAERHRTLEAFLAETALDPVEEAEADAADREDEMLTLSTIHSAKGLEWEAVVVLQLADGAFPHGSALDDPDALEEERRLLYVAVTRAIRELVLVQPRFVRAAWGRGPALAPSCTLLDEIDGIDDLVTVERGGRSRTEAAPPAEDAEELDRLARILGYFDRDR
jgi:DNA helicase-2/ATP-dependent DNA helicase PcrA